MPGNVPPGPPEAISHPEGMAHSSLPGRLILWRRDVAGLLGISRRTLDRMLAAGDVPSQDICLRGRRGWRTQTIYSWQARGCRKPAIDLR